MPALLVSISKLTETGDYNLSADRYREVIRAGKQTHPMVAIGDVCTFEYGKPLKSENRIEGEYPVFGSNGIVGYHNQYLVEAPFLVVGRKGSAGEVHYSDKNGFPIDTTFYVKLENEDKVILDYLFHVLKSLDLQSVNTQAGVPGLNRNDAYKIQIPLPPLEIQRQIVDEIAAHQRIIDGARQVLEGWKPEIEIDSNWEIVQLQKIAEVTSSKRIFQEEYVSSGVPFYRTKEVVELSEGEPISLELFISEERYEEIKAKFDVPKKEEILISAVGTIGISWVISDNRKFYFKDGNLLWIKNLQGVDPYYLKTVLDATLKYNLHKMIFGAAYKALTIITLKQLEIPLPSLEIQREIVARIESERKIVHGNRELIKIYEEKVKKVIERVWEA